MLLSPALYAIVKMDGIRGLARALNVDQAYVYRWKKNGLIPSKYHVQLLAVAKDKDIKLTAMNIIYGGNVHDSWIEKNMPWLKDKK